ncbi:PIN domain-like protein [Schizopora paradoxa]|uniref:PIN domain-like protein n=1 Tax=Schizopora paradoxa TaxID=27342 RepID=A0A0H2SCN5_9AGAM|nr:PIN domain-like protein [Schizopora paradoxa]
MGLIDEWSFFKHGVERKSLDELALEKPGPVPLLKIGIYANLWVREAWHATRAGFFLLDTENPLQWVLFRRLSRLYDAPVVPIFICDGPQIPSPRIASPTNAVPSEQHYLDELECFAKAFGFTWHKAPGEALAELAEMNRLSKIDVVLSEDTDAIVYGAESLIRRFNTIADDDAVRVDSFHSHAIRDANNSPISKGALLLMALMSGSGTLQPGIAGCELKTSFMLAHSGLGDRLYDAACSMNDESLQEFLDSWRELIKYELNQVKFLDHAYPTLAFRIDKTWPSKDVIKMFVHPATSLSLGISFPEVARKAARLGDIAAACELRFSFATPKAVLKVFKNILWDGIAMDTMIRHLSGELTDEELLEVAHIAKADHVDDETQTLYRLDVDISYAIHDVLDGLQGLRGPADSVEVVGYARSMKRTKAVWLRPKICDGLAHLLVNQFLVSFL